MGQCRAAAILLTLAFSACYARPGTVERVEELGDVDIALAPGDAVAVLGGGYTAISVAEPDKGEMAACVVAEMRQALPTLVIIPAQRFRDALQAWLQVDPTLQYRPSELLGRSEVRAVFASMKLRYAIVIDWPSTYADDVEPGRISSEQHTEVGADVWDLRQGRSLGRIIAKSVATGSQAPFPATVLNRGIDTEAVACRELGRRLASSTSAQGL